MNFIRTILTIWQRELIRYRRDRVRIIATIIQPLLFLLIFGVGLKQTLSTSNLGIDFIQFMYPGIIAMNVMGIAFFSAILTVWDREFGFLKEILVAPISRTAIALAKTLSSATVASFQVLILLLLAPFLGIEITTGIVLPLLLFILLIAFTISGLGLLIASRIQTTETFPVIMQVLIFPMFFLSGAFFPLTAVPNWMEALSKINPLTYGVDALRQILLQDQVPQKVIDNISLYTTSTDALFLLGFSVLMVGAAVLAFNRRS
ncbi:MAG: ABC transporter permease [Candidatus Colwellbacteria bacterium]|nr:ABC transporter permease [Candidatus Colwellbacteria bacterium]